MKKFFSLLASSLILVSLCSCSKDDAPGKAVDLGLSVKWSSYNLGASSPEDFGLYYSWGETETKSTFGDMNYKWYDRSEKPITKYNYNDRYGTVDNLSQLQRVDDAASVAWGDNWRIPTEKEIKELINNCTWIWGKKNGVVGYTVKSKVNKNSIFLPAGGHYVDDMYYNNTNYGDDYRVGFYWSSNIADDSPHRALILGFDIDSQRISIQFRQTGSLIRPVCR
ncbi:MAG: hypothetical protein IJ202_06325 [Bacteroidales bacterium]|nr:hypothetical protein [Bacteroidales bacterium]